MGTRGRPLGSAARRRRPSRGSRPGGTPAPRRGCKDGASDPRRRRREAAALLTEFKQFVLRGNVVDLMGWGTFNLVEGVVDHRILGIHHVNEAVPVGQRGVWDAAFLFWGAAMLVGGWAIARSGERERDEGAVGLGGSGTTRLTTGD